MQEDELDMPMWHVTRVEDDRIVHRDFVETSEGKNPFGRPRYRREDNLKMCLNQTGCEGVEWDS